MICPLCFVALRCFEEQTCEDVYCCQCENGYVGLYVCANEECSVSLITITEDCETCIKPV